MAENSDNFESFWSIVGFDLNMEKGVGFDMNMEKGGELDGCKSKVVSDDDIVNCLPVDPFGMDMQSTVTAIKGWLQDFDEDFGFNFDFDIDEDEKDAVDDGLLVGFNLFFDDSAVKLQPTKGVDLNAGMESVSDNRYNGFGVGVGLDNSFDSKLWNSIFNTSVVSVSDNCFNGFGVDKLDKSPFDSKLSNSSSCDKGKELQVGKGDPHCALFFTLGYLGVKDLLTVESVCRSLRDVVRGDPLLWRSIHIGQPLGEKLTNKALVKLTSRAQGNLQCLSLVNCSKITDDGLKQVLENNPHLTKLSVPSCMGLTIDGMLCHLKNLKSAGRLQINQLRISGLHDVREKHVEELTSLLSVDNHMHVRNKKPRFFNWQKFYLSCDYNWQQLYLPCDDDRPIDVDKCPKCQNLSLVYDCPSKSCKGTDQTKQPCRACVICIPRCFCCGFCLGDREYEETFSLKHLCLNCRKQLLGCDEPKVYFFVTG